MLTLFGTSGIRGKAHKLFINQFCFDIGRSFALFLDLYQTKGPVAVGMDPRGSSPRILKALESGLNFEKRPVADQGALPVPALNWVLKGTSYAGSVMVTGSHISGDLNGLKFFAFKEEILKSHEKEITLLYQKVKNKVAFRNNLVNITEENRAKEDYQEMLLGLAEKNYPKWRVVVDMVNGGQSDIMPQVLNRAGLKVTEQNASLQGPFIARDTETEGFLTELQKKVVQEKADFGIAYDYDGDRVVFVDEEGRFIPGDYTGTLIAKYSNTPVVVTPINTSQVVESLAKRVIRTKVGSPYVVQAMKKHGAAFGFEANGGGISAEIMMSRDGGSTTIKILNLLKQSGKKFSQFVNELPWFYLQRIKINCPREKNKLVLEMAEKKLKGIKKDKLDGLKIWLDDSTWVFFRPSSNAAEFRVFSEAKKEDMAIQLAQKGLELVKGVIKK